MRMKECRYPVQMTAQPPANAKQLRRADGFGLSLSRNLARGVALIALLCAVSTPAFAQDAAVAPTAAPSPAPVDPVIDFTAESVEYDSDADRVIAAGNVLMQREAWRLRADRVEWDRRSGAVIASGNVEMTSPEGDRAFGDRVELTDSLRDGVVDNLLVVLENGGRVAAGRGERLANGDMVLDRAVYSPCPVVDGAGCDRRPSWQVRAVRVTYDRTAQRLRYSGARFQLFGLELPALPGFSHPVGDQPGNGFLLPELELDRVNGLEVTLPYYLQLSPTLDVTLSPHLFTNAAPMAEAQLRGLVPYGAFQAQAYATYSRRLDLSGTSESNALRGYFDATAGFQFAPRWSLSASARVASDRTFLRRYDISRDDRLRNHILLRRQSTSSLLLIEGWATQTLRAGDSQGQQPIALPLIDFRRRFTGGPLGGTVMLRANTLSLFRTSGQDTQRAFASAQWEARRITPLGQLLTLSTMARADVYHTDNVLASPILSYRGEEGWGGRAFAGLSADAQWPLFGSFAGGRLIFNPRVQLAWTSPVDNASIPNEDARAVELEDGNIFALNRFPGQDRVEDGARLTYGVEANWAGRAVTVDATLAQSQRLDDRPTLFPDGTGLANAMSDVVGRLTVAWRDFVRLTHRFRLDEDNLAVRRNEFDATVGSRRTYAIIGYSRFNRDIVGRGEDLRDREEARLGGRIQIARYWSIFGSAIVDLTDREEDPLSTADGFEPVRHRLGISYDDECLTIGLTWRRDYQDSGDARAGNSFQLRLALRNLGV